MLRQHSSPIRRVVRTRLAASVEALERRALLAGDAGTGVAEVLPPGAESVVYGVAFLDRNANGAYEPLDQPVAGATAYLDLDRSGSPDPGEPSALTGPGGRFDITVAETGTYVVRVVFPAGHVPTAPAGGFSEVTVESSAPVGAGDFGAYTLAPVSGVVFVDRAANGTYEFSDPGLPAARVYADLNANQLPDAGEPATSPDARGQYRLDLVPGTYTIRAAYPPTYVPVLPASGSYSVTATSGAGATGKNFAAYRPALVEGYLFQDYDGDTVRDAGEPYIVGRRLFADVDRDGVRDANEPSTLSRLRGWFRFDLKPGTYLIRQELPAGWTATTAPPLVIVTSGSRPAPRPIGSNAKGSISGTVYADIDGDGQRDTGGTTIAEGKVYLDANDNGALDPGERTNSYSLIDGFRFADVPVGRHVVRVAPPEGWRQTSPAGDAPVVVTVRPNTSSSVTFLVAPVPTPNSIGGNLFEDANGNGVRDANEASSLHRTVYLDTNNNGVMDASEPSQYTYTAGWYRFVGLTPGTYRVRQVVNSGWAQTAPADDAAHTVVLRDGEIITGKDFGTVRVPTVGRVQGHVYEDADANGIMTDADAPLAGALVYLDLNNNGSYDVGDPAGSSDAFGYYSVQPPFGTPAPVTLRLIVLSGYRAGEPASASYAITPPTSGGATWRDFGMARAGVWVTGTAYNDLDRDGVRDPGEPGLADQTVFADANDNWKWDTGERYDFTRADGGYTVRDVPGATIKVRIDPRGDFALTAPAGDGAYTLAGSASYKLYAGRDFGIDASRPGGSISGTVFYDVDHDGLTTGDPGLYNWTVYVDADGDHVPDPDERRATTSPFGTYAFGDLAPGTYNVRVDVPTTFNQTAPASNAGRGVAVAPGQAVTGVDFGAKEKTDFRGSISGALFNDADADGVKDASEAALPGWRVFIDDDRDGVLDAWERSVLTDAAGNFRFANLAYGNHRIRPVIQSGWRPTSPAPGYQDFPQTSDMITSEMNFLLTQKVLISGSVFNDADGDANKDSGEAGLSGWKVFLDADNDGVLDSGEKNLLTDAGGNWKFDNLAAGTYHVRVVQQTGWTRTTPTSGSYDVTLAAGKTSTGKLFGQKR